MDTQSLIEAAETGATEVVDQLLKSGANVNARPGNGTTALIRAASNNHVETVRLLLANGADINATRSDGMTALILAAFFGHTETVAALLEHGADLKARDQLGSTALDWALSRGYTETFEFLKKASLDKAELDSTAVGSVSAQAIASLSTEIGSEPKSLTAWDNDSEDVLDLGEAFASTPSVIYTQDDDPIDLNPRPEADIPVDVEAFDADETTLISPSPVPKVPVSVPLESVMVARRPAPPFRSNVWLLAFTWFVVFSFCAALTYALTRNSSLVQNTTVNAPPQPPAPSADSQITYTPPPRPTQSEEQSSVAPNVSSTASEHPATTQPTVSEVKASERKEKPHTESLPNVESAHTGARAGEVKPEPPRPSAKPKTSPMPNNNEAVRRDTTAVAPPEAPPVTVRNTPPANDPQPAPAQPNPAPTPKKKVIRWP